MISAFDPCIVGHIGHERVVTGLLTENQNERDSPLFTNEGVQGAARPEHLGGLEWYIEWCGCVNFPANWVSAPWGPFSMETENFLS